VTGRIAKKFEPGTPVVVRMFCPGHTRKINGSIEIMYPLGHLFLKLKFRESLKSVVCERRH